LGQHNGKYGSDDLDSFRRLNYPGYDTDFIETIEKVITNVRIDMAGKSEEAKQLLNALLYKRRRVLY
jgi:hypothetical protein